MNNFCKCSKSYFLFSWCFSCSSSSTYWIVSQNYVASGIDYSILTGGMPLPLLNSTLDLIGLSMTSSNFMFKSLWFKSMVLVKKRLFQLVWLYLQFCMSLFFVLLLKHSIHSFFWLLWYNFLFITLSKDLEVISLEIY